MYEQNSLIFFNKFLLIILLSSSISIQKVRASYWSNIKTRLTHEVKELNKCLRGDTACDQLRKKTYITGSLLISAAIIALSTFGGIHLARHLTKGGDEAIKAADN